MSLNRSSLAATSFVDLTGWHVRVYYQAVSGDIKEVNFGGNDHWDPVSQNTIGTGKLNTGIAALTINDNDGYEIRVYYLDQNSKIVEMCSSGDGVWVSGGLTGKFQAAPYSKIAALNVKNDDDTLDLRVYYQDTTNKLREIVYVPGWTEGTQDLPVALAGTSLAAAVDADSTKTGQIWLYYQDGSDLSLKGYWFDGSAWKAGSFKAEGDFPPGASISAASGAPPPYRVASVNQNNQICFTSYEDGAWGKTYVPSGLKTNTLSEIALISITGLHENGLFYHKEGGDIVATSTFLGGIETWYNTISNVLDDIE